MITWKPIPGFEEFEASTEGHIRDATQKKLIREYTQNSGYLMVYLQRRGNYLVHRLVCATYHEQTDLAKQVNHINGVVTDNRPENLEWVTERDNVRDFWNNPIFAEKRANRREQISECMSTRVWITDGTKNYRVLPENLNEYPTFHRGQTRKSDK